MEALPCARQPSLNWWPTWVTLGIVRSLCWQRRAAWTGNRQANYLTGSRTLHRRDHGSCDAIAAACASFGPLPKKPELPQLIFSTDAGCSRAFDCKLRTFYRPAYGSRTANGRKWRGTSACVSSQWSAGSCFMKMIAVMSKLSAVLYAPKRVKTPARSIS